MNKVAFNQGRKEDERVLTDIDRKIRGNRSMIAHHNLGMASVGKLLNLACRSD